MHACRVSSGPLVLLPRSRVFGQPLVVREFLAEVTPSIVMSAPACRVLLMTSDLCRSQT
jgi:hypothetical protein